MKQTIFRQGDVLLVQVDAVPVDAVPVKIKGDVILAWGEVTGHAHRLAPKAIRPFAKGGVWSADAERFIAVAEATALTHEEHSSITLPPGNYKVIQQREYTPSEIRRVAD